MVVAVVLWPSAMSTVLSGDNSSRDFSMSDKLDPRWEPDNYKRKSFKPIPKEELSPIHGVPPSSIKSVEHVWHTTSLDASRHGILLPLLSLGYE